MLRDLRDLIYVVAAHFIKRACVSREVRTRPRADTFEDASGDFTKFAAVHCGEAVV